MARKKATVVAVAPKDVYLYPGYPAFSAPTFVGLYDGDWCMVAGEHCRTGRTYSDIIGVWAAWKLVRGLYPGIDNKFHHDKIEVGSGNLAADNRQWAVVGLIAKGGDMFRIAHSEHESYKRQSATTGIKGYTPVLVPQVGYKMAYVGTEIPFSEVEGWSNVDGFYQTEVRKVKEYCDKLWAQKKEKGDVAKEPRREAPQSDADALRMLRAAI